MENMEIINNWAYQWKINFNPEYQQASSRSNF